MLANIKSLISKRLAEKNIFIRKTIPRPSTVKAKQLFKNKPLKIIEIGTFEGRNAASLLKELNVKKLYCVDPYVQYLDYNKDGIYELLRWGREQAHTKLPPIAKKKGTEIKWIEKFSSDAAKHFKDGQFDFVYVDGNHNYDYVKKDLEMYWSKLRRGGILAGHDIDWSGVFQAVGEFSLKNDLNLELKYPDWWIVKK